MFFGLKYVEHNLEEIHKIIEHFFDELSKKVHTDFSDALLPIPHKSIIIKGSSTTGKLNKLGGLLKNVFVEFQGLADTDKDLVGLAFIDSNKIEAICEKHSIPVPENALPSAIQKSFKELFDYLYKDKDKLIDGVLTANHYENFLSENGNPRICAFCCLETIPHGGEEGRANYDHYLPKAQFPFSAINLRNLVPTGTTCNQNVKGEKVIAFKDKDLTVSTFAFYPFDENFYALDVMDFHISCKEKPTIKNNGGVWEVKIIPKDTSNRILTEKIESWDRVFEIQTRYAREVKIRLMSWVEIFKSDSENLNSYLNKELKLNKEKVKSEVAIVAKWLFFDFLSKDVSLKRLLIPASSSTKKPEDFI
ncbi:MAG: hypothetical protein MUE85_09265 [Microscillaceae bacterium]|jgi:hypothetical protein|nr:hypothetical protein [Microscillaceae bacterium]